MILLITISLIFSIISGFAKAVMDLSEEGKIKFKPSRYWVKAMSSPNKWKDGDPRKGGETYEITNYIGGAVASLFNLVGGTGYSDAINVATTGGTGTGLTVDITTSGGVITDVVVNNEGSGYSENDIIAISSGTVTVATSSIKTGYKIYLSVNTPSGTQGFLSAQTGSIVDETSFVINSTNAGDNSTVNWWIAP